MTVETDLFTVLGGIAAFTDPRGTKRVFPSVAPLGVGRPFATYQQVGGKPANFVAGLPSKRNGIFQLNVWADTHAEAVSLMRQIEDAVRQSGELRAVTLSGLVATYEPDTKLHGARQDFSLWFEA